MSWGTLLNIDTNHRHPALDGQLDESCGIVLRPPIRAHYEAPAVDEHHDRKWLIDLDIRNRDIEVETIETGHGRRGWHLDAFLDEDVEFEFAEVLGNAPRSTWVSQCSIWVETRGACIFNSVGLDY